MAKRRRVQLGGRLGELAGDAPERAPNVRALARFAANSACKLANLGFAARVDFDKLFVGTPYEVPFGQSQFAFRRGNLFEERLREGKHARLRALLSPVVELPAERIRVENLRGETHAEKIHMPGRAERTRQVMEGMLRGRKDAPNLLDGAVLERKIGGVQAYFEADAVAAHGLGAILAGEIKSFPTVDGQADPEKVGAAMSQVAIYLLLMRDLLLELGAREDVVSTRAFLITPRNTGLQPTLAEKDVGRELDRAERILRSTPDADDIVESLPATLPSFGTVAHAPSLSQRIEAASCLTEAVGTHYGPACLSSCGFSRFCRERMHTQGDASRYGGSLVRLLPGVESLDRVAELAGGAKPTAAEAPVQQELVRAADWMAAVSPAPTPSNGRRRAPAKEAKR